MPKRFSRKKSTIRPRKIRIPSGHFSTVTRCETVGCLCEPVRRIRVRASAGDAARGQHVDENLMFSAVGQRTAAHGREVGAERLVPLQADSRSSRVAASRSRRPPASALAACRNHGVIATCKPASMPAIAHSLAAMPGAAKPARARGRARAWPGSRRRCREPPARREAPGADDAAALKPCSLPGASLRHACRNPVRASRLLSNHDIYRIFSNSGVKSWHDSSVVRHFMPLPRRLFAVWPSPGPVLASGPCRYVVPRSIRVVNSSCCG